MPLKRLATLTVLRDSENAQALDQGFGTLESTRPDSLTNLIKRDYREGSPEASGR